MKKLILIIVFLLLSCSTDDLDSECGIITGKFIGSCSTVCKWFIGVTNEVTGNEVYTAWSESYYNSHKLGERICDSKFIF